MKYCDSLVKLAYDVYCLQFLYWNLRDLNQEGHYANKLDNRM